MPLPPNPSFEGPGVTVGWAADWTVSVVFAGYMIADFGESGIPRPVETFAGGSWGTDLYVVMASGGGALFDSDEASQPNSAETFGWWAFNFVYQVTVEGGVAAVNETFLDASWGTAPYETTVAAGSVFSETFESGWVTYVTTVTGGTSATFEGGATVEGFESVSADVLFVVDNPATGLCTTPAPHGKANGFKVTTLATGLRPGGLVANQVYYLVNVGASSFQLAKTMGGGAVTFADYGSGSLYLHADEELYWTATGDL